MFFDAWRDGVRGKFFGGWILADFGRVRYYLLFFGSDGDFEVVIDFDWFLSWALHLGIDIE